MFKERVNKMNVHEKKEFLQEASVAAASDMQSSIYAFAIKVASLSGRVRLMIAGSAMALYYTLFAGYAYAAGCKSGAASDLVDFIDNAANFMMAIGGAGALLMFAVAAFFIITGHKESQVSKGFKMVKNALIGLAILAAGFFLKEVLLKFISGATSTRSSKCVEEGKGLG
jgi:hypothetical protein